MAKASRVARPAVDSLVSRLQLPDTASQYLYSLKEADAFRRIQKLSMDSRKSMREIAEAILLASEIDKN